MKATDADVDVIELTEDELAERRAGADGQMQALREIKEGVARELDRREVLKLAEGLSAGQRQALLQELGGVGGIDSSAAVGEPA